LAALTGEGKRLATERVRVVHVITRMILGGAQEDALLTLEGLRAGGAYEVGLITGPELGTEGELLSRARAVGIPVHIVRPMCRRVSPGLDLLAAAELRRIFAETRPTIVQSHSSKAGVLTRWAAKRAGVPIIVHRIHGLAFHPFGGSVANAVFRSAERAVAAKADRLISVADCLTRTCLDAGIGRTEQYVTIPTGIETAPYLNTPPDLRARVRRELGIAPDDIVFVKVARLFELKGHEFILEAASAVLRSVPRAKFLFVGGGPRRDELEHAARALPPGTVRFTGLVAPERVPEILAASDCLVHSSLREGLPRVFAQAHFAGLPVVAFDLDGAPEIVTDGETGRLVPARDVEALAEAMVEMGTDTAKAEAFGKLGRKRSLERFSARALVRSTDALYRELLAEKGLPLPPGSD
jgi:glycosyltransferase involved in cell wall biosynthesis